MDGTSKFTFVLWFAFIEKALATDVKHKFTFIETPMTWNEALHTCRDLGMSLIQVESFSKHLYIEENKQKWHSHVTGPVWMGLHETSNYPQPSYAWSNCSLLGSYNNFLTTFPPVVDDAFCVAMDMLTTSQWIVKRCNEQFKFLCEQVPGPCTFTLTPDKGCFHSMYETSEVPLSQCIEECRSMVRTDGTECWGVGHYPGFAGDDCRKIYSNNPDICIQTMGNLLGGTLGVKVCLEVSIITAVPPVSDSGLYPDTQCFVNATADPPATTQPTTSTPSLLSTSGTESTTTTTVLDTTTTTTTTTTTAYTTTADTATTDTATTTQMTPSTANSTCVCLCQNSTHFQGIDEAEFQRILSSIVINKKDTSSYRRKFISAEDNRPSAVAVGLVGITMLVVSLGSIILLDLPLLILNFKVFYNKICKCS